MHGADRDILWLQRDFGIYICNMFDTGQVCLKSSDFSLLRLFSYSISWKQNHMISYTVAVNLYVKIFFNWLMLPIHVRFQCLAFHVFIGLVCSAS